MDITVLLVAVLGSSVISALVTGVVSIIIKLIDRKDKKDSEQNKIASLEEQIKETQKDGTRMQMLMLIQYYPTAEMEILQLAEKYFIELDGNWYMSGIFNHWLNDHPEAKEEWEDRLAVIKK